VRVLYNFFASPSESRRFLSDGQNDIVVKVEAAWWSSIRLQKLGYLFLGFVLHVLHA